MHTCVFCNKEKKYYAQGLCQACYSRAYKHKRSGRGFDPAYIPESEKKPTGRPAADRKPCWGCETTENYYARGLCHNCYARASRHEKQGRGFIPGHLPQLQRFLTMGKTALTILRTLSSMPHEVAGKRLVKIGAELAKVTGVSRQRVYKILQKLQQRGWISFQIVVKLPPEVEALLAEKEEA